jgi:hypothetical protein
VANPTRISTPGDRLNPGAGGGGLPVAVDTGTGGVNPLTALVVVALVVVALVVVALVVAALLAALVVGGVWWGGFGIVGAHPAKHGGDDLATVAVRQRAIQEAHVEVGADLGQQAGVPGTSDLGGELVDAGHRRGGLVGGQAVAADGHGAVWVEIGDHAAFAHCLAVTPGRPLGVVFEDHAPQPVGQFPGGPPGRRADQRGTDRGLQRCGQVVEVIGEHPRLVPIQPSRHQTSVYLGQVSDHPLGEAQFPSSFTIGPGQQRGDLPVGPLAGVGKSVRLPGRGGGPPPRLHERGQLHPELVVFLPLLGLEEGQGIVVAQPCRVDPGQGGDQRWAGR